MARKISHNKSEILFTHTFSFHEHPIEMIKIQDTWYYYMGNVVEIIGYAKYSDYSRILKGTDIEYIYICDKKQHSYISYNMLIKLLDIIISAPKTSRAIYKAQRVRNASELQEWIISNYINHISFITQHYTSKGDNDMSTQEILDHYKGVKEKTAAQHDNNDILAEAHQTVVSAMIHESDKHIRKELDEMICGSDKKLHKELTEQLHDTYVQKNTAYGSSFDDTYKEYGIMSAATRIADKYNRFKTLAKDYGNGKINSGDESIKDTLMDMANYCLLTIMAITNDKQTK